MEWSLWIGFKEQIQNMLAHENDTENAKDNLIRGSDHKKIQAIYVVGP